MENNSVPIKKKCCHCRHVKPTTLFSKNHNRPDGLKPTCKDCDKAYRLGNLTEYQEKSRAYYLKNRKRILQYNKDNRERFRKRRTAYQKKIRVEHRQILVNELGKKCIVCGDKDPWNLDFHHLDPSQKEFNIGRHIGVFGLERLRTEAKKCVLICCKHHRMLTAGLIQLPKEGK